MAYIMLLVLIKDDESDNNTRSNSMKWVSLMVMILLSMPLHSITNNIYTVSEYLDKRTYYFSGKFYYHDFANVPAHYDFVYEAYTGEILQLRGNVSNADDLFGWKEVDIPLPSRPLYYFIYLGDFDADNDSRFDWILVHLDKQIAYKLIGKSLSDTFVWSQKLPLSLDVQGDFVAFEKTFMEESSIGTDEAQESSNTQNSTTQEQSQTTNTTTTTNQTTNEPNIPTTPDNGDMPPTPPI